MSPLTSNSKGYTQYVPGQCDRIVWRGSVYMLPLPSTPSPDETREPPRQLELTNELRWILGRPCFMVIPMVQCLRKMGRHIDTKAEDEQAVAIHWMLSLYLEHGADKWRDEAEKILKEGQRQANELKASEQPKDHSK